MKQFFVLLKNMEFGVAKHEIINYQNDEVNKFF